MADVKKITIGIPVYKVEEYIDQCLQSVLDQTYRDLEVIIIDDCTPDNAGSIADRYAEKDNRFTVIHKKENKGLAAARNTILEAMTGDAVYWLDSDDYLKQNAIENAVEIMNQTGADIVKTVLIKSELPFIGIYGKEEYLHILLPNRIKSNVIGCLIRKEAYSGVTHPEGMNYENYFAFPRLVNNCERIVVEGSGTYCYRVLRAGSITASEHAAFKGYMTRAALNFDRYNSFLEWGDEKAAVLKEFADNACMACLYAKKGTDLRDHLYLMNFEKRKVYNSKIIHPYKKFLYRSILARKWYVPLLGTAHRMSGRMRCLYAKIQKPEPVSI